LGEIGVLLGRRMSAGFVGRQPERAVLAELSDPDGSLLLVHLHGIAGVGKSTLMSAALDDARAQGVTVVRLDCRAIEPTERGFLHELRAAVGDAGDGVDEVAARLGSLGSRVMLALDNYEVFRLMDAWLRQVFVPALDANARVLVAGREPPLPAWFASPEWQGLFRSVPLGPLEERDALELLARCEVGDEVAERINRVARGHPLALKLAASALTERPDLGLEEAAMQRVVDELTRVFLADVQDPATRRALDAASVVRRATLPLLGAMLPDAAPQDAFDRLGALPFVESSRDGLVLHDAVRQASAAALRAADPGRYRDYRRAAWRALRAEVSTAGTPELWRYTADALYLIENPTVREAFFPTGVQVYGVEPARAGDGEAIRMICELHDPPGSVGWLASWWAEAPEAFVVIRDREGALAGFYAMFDPTTADRGLLWRDPVTRVWAEHLRDHPVPNGDRVLFLRRWLGVEGGEGPSPVQAAGWLDIKRTYMALRPALRRVYTTVQDLATWAPIVSRLHFAPLTGSQIDFDGVVHHSAMLDFGPSSVDGWLADLVAEELGIEDHLSVDAASGELRLDGRRIALTPLELGVIDVLIRQEGQVVTRRTLLAEVWGSRYEGGSNIVDSVVRSLRKKLGPQASSVETVRGYGYRFRRA
jgi:Transcriptional regulatory protein, C terminal